MNVESLDRNFLRDNRIGSYDVFYIPNFLSAEEEQYILRKVLESPRQKWKQLANRRLQIWGGEITAKGLLPQSLPSYFTVYPAVIDRLRRTGAFELSPHQEPNHIILNEYQPGQGIMPHEDGPKYFPLVATISLGSHTVFNYYRYKGAPDGEGKVVDEVPRLSVLLEPRSLIISSGDMYTSYLHGIDSIEEDVVFPSIQANVAQSTASHVSTGVSRGMTPISNWESLGDEETKQIIACGGVLKRGTRYSLTCRDVERISSARLFSFI